MRSKYILLSASLALMLCNTCIRIAVLFDGAESTAPHVDIADIEHKASEKQGEAQGVVKSVKSVESA